MILQVKTLQQKNTVTLSGGSGSRLRSSRLRFGADPPPSPAFAASPSFAFRSGALKTMACRARGSRGESSALSAAADAWHQSQRASDAVGQQLQQGSM